LHQKLFILILPLILVVILLIIGDFMAANQVTIQRTNTGQLTITIPIAIAGSKGWGKGTKLEFVDDRYGETVLKEVKE